MLHNEMKEENKGKEKVLDLYQELTPDHPIKKLVIEPLGSAREAVGTAYAVDVRTTNGYDAYYIPIDAKQQHGKHHKILNLLNLITNGQDQVIYTKTT